MNIRPGNPYDLTILRRLYADTIRNVCRSDYDEGQVNVWAANEQDENRWNKVMNEQTVIVAEDSNEIAGFCTLTDDGYIDLLFVHKSHQRKGIAKLLYKELEHTALLKGIALLTADVSKTAKPFFENMGFSLLKEQKVSVQGILLVNYKMEKSLA